MLLLTLGPAADAAARGRTDEPSPMIGVVVLIGLAYAAYKAVAKAIGESLAASVAVGIFVSFMAGVVPLCLLALAHMIFKFDDMATAMGWTAIAWMCLGVAYSIRSNWAEIAEERKKRRSNKAT